MANLRKAVDDCLDLLARRAVANRLGHCLKKRTLAQRLLTAALGLRHRSSPRLGAGQTAGVRTVQAALYIQLGTKWSSKMRFFSSTPRDLGREHHGDARPNVGWGPRR